MNGRPQFVSILFVLFCAAGIFVMFSQTHPTSDAGRNGEARWATFNPGAGEPAYRELLPRVIDRSTRPHIHRHSARTPKDESEKRGVLRLR